MDNAAKIARLKEILPTGRNFNKFSKSRYVMNDIVTLSNAELAKQKEYYKGSTEAYWNDIEAAIDEERNNNNNNMYGGKRRTRKTIRKTHKRKTHKRRTHKRRTLRSRKRN
jgi:hypothetical protein